MTSLARQKILEKFERLDEYLGYLYQIRDEAKTEKSFLDDFHLYGNTERYLQLSIQAIIDISHLIIIDLGLTRPEDNYEAVSILFKNKVFSEGLSEKLTKMIGLRNILVHEYGRIERKKIYKILKTQLKDLEMFKKQVVKFIKS